MTFPIIGSISSIPYIFENLSTSSGDVDFDVNSQQPLSMLIENFTMLDAGGEPISADSGIVTLSTSVADDLFRYMKFGRFHIQNVNELWWQRPRIFGLVSKIRVNMDSIVGSGVVGFRMRAIQDFGAGGRA